MLGIDAAHAVRSVSQAGGDERPGIWLTIEGKGLPETQGPYGKIPSQTLAEYLDLLDRLRGYVPAKMPVQASDPNDWPKFPGEGEDYSSLRGPLARNSHMGGPR